MRRALPILILASCCASAAVGVAAAPAATTCTAGVHPFGGVNARTFCGPAEGTPVVGGRTIPFAGGACGRGRAVPRRQNRYGRAGNGDEAPTRVLRAAWA